ncbi:alpha/beta hydrolase [Stieleria sp. JC731]|uniref:alpha/beta hydrolase n=1 Tax=Pirellulaceae TaxID=2691357 RepID=UPI001E52EB98|nr:alpha/beta hydrolase [Stieleria sp. JC731]MCC9601266.1 alpha/beta hydrolase [Stieleria sp. JC731]
MRLLIIALGLALLSGHTSAQQVARYQITPTAANVSYGSHERQVLDFWQASESSPSPLVIHIHGGGFVGGDKTKLSQKVLKSLLDSGISVATINYRFLAHSPLPAAHDDAAKAIQFLRSKADQWKIDKNRVGAVGGSAGAQLVMYLAFHDDFADPSSDDPIERQSTRLTCVASNAGQVTMAMKWWDANVPGYKDRSSKKGETARYFGTSSDSEVQRINQEIAALSLISSDDPPVYMTYAMDPADPAPKEPRLRNGWMIHHVNHGLALKERCDELGVESYLNYPGTNPEYRNATEFLRAKLQAEVVDFVRDP